MMNVIICDLCGEKIKVNGHILTITKGMSIFDDVECRYDVCDKCYIKMTDLWNKSRASFKVTISK